VPELNDGEGAGPLGQGAALGSGEARGPAHGEGGRVSWLGTDGVVENRGGSDRGGLPEGDNGGGRGQPNRRGPLLIVACCVGATRACAEGEREVMARHGGRAMGVHARRGGKRGRVKGTRAAFVRTSASRQ
jgi:hypothetical protein